MFIQDQRDVEDNDEILCKRVLLRGQSTVVTTSSQSVSSPLCFGCGLPIQDQYYLVAAEQTWHIECLKCSVCDAKLEAELTCFAKDGEIYCKNDYQRKFSKRCARCNRVLTAKELVMRAKELIYHLPCFNCIICGVSLNPGEYFGLSTNGYIYCRSHYEPLLYPAISTENDPNSLKSEESSPTRSLSSTDLKTPKGRPKKRKNLGIHGGSNHDAMGHNNCLMIPGDEHLSAAQQTRNKRMRTSFKHHQLRTMKAYFGLNHNPDAKDLKQLAQKTGLTKRVLQVWFQNARAKYRRSVQCKPGCTPDISTKETSITGEQMKEIPGRNDPPGEDCEKDPEEDSQDRHELVSSSSEVSPNTMDICYSPAFGSLSDDETASKSLADYFQSCDST